MRADKVIHFSLSLSLPTQVGGYETKPYLAAMKVLHTADWHLGQKLLQNDRHEEFQMALDWLLQAIVAEKIEVLLVSGDIFDIGNPPNQARQLYYNFLGKLMNTPCKHVVITGGNHDSPAMLNAPKALLEAFNIHIVGAYSGAIEDELILLKDEKGEVSIVIAAVPFLRDRDLRISMAGESQKDKNARLQEGLTAHYNSLAALMQPYKKKGAVAIAMGHLFAKGAVAADKQDNIYLGNRENMKAGQFSSIFDYVALGHIHRAQRVGEAEHIRYSGSLIPLSFSERGDTKGVYVLDIQNGRIKNTKNIRVPVFRRLKSIEGDLDKVQQSLERFTNKKQGELTPWVEVKVLTEEYIPQLDKLLRDFTEQMDLELVKIRVIRPYQSLVIEHTDLPDLEDMKVDEVFKKRCTSQGDMSEEQIESLMATFGELKEWMQSR